MKLILKNLKQVEYEIYVESDKLTIKDLKLEIEKLYSFDSEQIKLISNGTILEDSYLLSDYKIKDNSTIIIMNIKTKKKENLNMNTNMNNPKSENNNSKSENNNSQIKIQPEQINKSNITKIINDNLTIQINSLVDMGFEKTQVEAAVKAANGRIDLAVEYLNNGIPDNINDNNRNINRQKPKIESDITKELKKTAGVIKMLCKDNKRRIFGILNNIKLNDPGLLRLITDYQNEFKKYLDEPITEEEKENYQNLESRADQIQKQNFEKFKKDMEEKIKKGKEEKEKKEKEEKEKKEKEEEEKKEKELQEKMEIEEQKEVNKEEGKEENKIEVKDKEEQKEKTEEKSLEQKEEKTENKTTEEKTENKKEEKIEDKKEENKEDKKEENKEDNNVDKLEEKKNEEMKIDIKKENDSENKKEEDKDKDKNKKEEVEETDKNIEKPKEIVNIEKDNNNKGLSNENENKEQINKTENNSNSNSQLFNQLTEEEKIIVKRIKGLVDFSLETVVEAFIVCNKNEELTANYLFDLYN